MPGIFSLEKEMQIAVCTWPFRFLEKLFFEKLLFSHTENYRHRNSSVLLRNNSFDLWWWCNKWNYPELKWTLKARKSDAEMCGGILKMCQGSSNAVRFIILLDTFRSSKYLQSHLFCHSPLMSNLFLFNRTIVLCNCHSSNQPVPDPCLLVFSE